MGPEYSHKGRRPQQKAPRVTAGLRRHMSYASMPGSPEAALAKMFRPPAWYVRI
jgi:hypothetical protein